jgi:hypothetical protein
MNRLRNKENNSIHNKKIKYKAINLTEEVKDLYNENYKTFEKGTKNGKTSHVHGSVEYYENSYTTYNNIQI